MVRYAYALCMCIYKLNKMQDNQTILAWGAAYVNGGDLRFLLVYAVPRLGPLVSRTNQITFQVRSLSNKGLCIYMKKVNIK